MYCIFVLNICIITYIKYYAIHTNILVMIILNMHIKYIIKNNKKLVTPQKCICTFFRLYSVYTATIKSLLTNIFNKKSYFYCSLYL